MATNASTKRIRSTKNLGLVLTTYSAFSRSWRFVLLPFSFAGQQFIAETPASGNTCMA
jgi:hypothetical protein